MNEFQSLKDRAVIVLAGSIDLDLAKLITADDYIVAVDGGYDHLHNAGLTPDIVIGDFDSIAHDYLGKKLQLSPVKDDTDFKCALNYINQNHLAKQIVVVGFASLNRIDHVLANLANAHGNISFVSANQHIQLTTESVVVKRDDYKYYSFFALEQITDFTLSGFKYPLTNYCLKPFDPLCVSNELIADSGTIEISNGKLIIIKSLLN